MDSIILNHEWKLRMSKPNKQILALTSLIGHLLFFHVIVFAESSSSTDKNRDIFKLLEVSGLLEQMDYIKEEATNSYARVISLTYPKVPDQFWDDFNKLAGKEEMKVLLDRVVAVYDKHMSHEVVKQLITMFSTPFWSEWKQKMPTISREAGLIGSQWTQELLQSHSFKKKLDSLVSKYDLEKLNSVPETSRSKNESKK
jgi:hypothetical protein